MRAFKKLPVEVLAPYLLPDVPRGTVGQPIHWHELFGNNNPVEVEVGFGKGLFLCTAAKAKPDVNFFGVEIVRKYQLVAATRFFKEKIPNVRVACDDARMLLKDRVADGSVQAVHVYFPDPWWKARHKRRRVFNEDFAKTIAMKLKPTGKLHFVSDVEEYFNVVVAMLREMPEVYRELPAPVANEPQHDLDYLTNFERKFRKEGRPIYRSLFERI